MVNEMIDRVADLIAIGVGNDHDSVDIARAILASMREPTTQQMTNYTEMKIKNGEKKAFSVSEWEIMIDAALKED